MRLRERYRPVVLLTERAVRRLFDCGAALSLLFLCAPVLLGAALAIARTSPGPLFFRQARVGRGGRLFRIWKFRTMVWEKSVSGPSVTASDDSRITPLGRRLRAWKLDELPQLLNVLCGEMSLVGPRPQVPCFVARFDPMQREIVLSVRPGMTGPASLVFRHEEQLLAGKDDREGFYINTILPLKLAIEVEYVQARSLPNDGRILAETLCLVCCRVGRAVRRREHSLKRQLRVAARRRTLTAALRRTRRV